MARRFEASSEAREVRDDFQMMEELKKLYFGYMNFTNLMEKCKRDSHGRVSVSKNTFNLIREDLEVLIEERKFELKNKIMSVL